MAKCINSWNCSFNYIINEYLLKVRVAVVETAKPWRKDFLLQAAQEERYCILYLGLICPDVPPVSCPAQANPLGGTAGNFVNLCIRLIQDMCLFLTRPISLVIISLCSSSRIYSLSSRLPFFLQLTP